MRVHVILRGGVGDIMLYMLKFLAIERKHKEDDIYCYLASTWFEGCKVLIEKHTSMFKSIEQIEYSRPVNMMNIAGILECDKLYNFEIWDEENNCLTSIYKIHPELQINYFPSLKYNKMESKNNVISFQPIGKSWGSVWSADHWEKKLASYRSKYSIFLLGEHEGFNLNNYANRGLAFKDISEIVDVISNSKLFISMDSGFKNIALAQMIPTLFIWANQKDVEHCIVNKDTWFLPYYQNLDYISLHHLKAARFFDIAIEEVLTRKPTFILIPVFNELEYTKKCYESIKKYTRRPYRIVFINNGSTDGTKDYLDGLEFSDPKVLVIHNKENLGFAKAINQGMDHVGYDDIMLLNNDVEVTQNWLEKLHIHLYASSETGIVGPMTNYSGSPEQIGQADDLLPSKEAKHLSGFCYYIKNELFKTIGYMDERYFLAGEDYHYTARARKAGFKIMLAQNVFVKHEGHATAKNLPNANEEWRKSRDLFVKEFPEER